MALGLNLAESIAKVDRACEHLDALKGALAEIADKGGPYSIRSGNLDQETGWAAFYLTQQPLTDQMRLAAILGDVYHNLRSALDYIVTSLVAASGGTLATHHQFPVFKDGAHYHSKVGGTPPLPKGYLGGVKYGITEIRNLQPYQTKPDPQANPLWHLNRFSNADKHRQITVIAFPPGPGDLNVDADGQIIATRTPLGGDWEKDGEVDIGGVRFSRPYPTYVRANAKVAIDVHFIAPPAKQEPDRIAHDLPFLEELCGHVRMVVELFKTL